MTILDSLPAKLLTGILLIQGSIFYGVASRAEHIPDVAPLANFPRMAGQWAVVRETQIEKEVQDVLRADDTLTRIYVDPQGREASFFVAFFKTQRFGQTPHSPKNCLPGSGWEPLKETRMPIQVPGRAEPIEVNQYIIAHGENRSVVLYWYQSHGRVIAKELSAKMWLVADAIRYHRSDTALIRVIVPVTTDEASAEKLATGFVQAVYPEVVQQLPQ